MSSAIERRVSLREFYTDKTILITGATGFLGHILVEKYLRSFPQIKKLYFVIRAKRNKTSRQRIDEYFENDIFGRLKKEKPESLEKVYGLEGDVTLENFGLRPNEVKHLLDEVNVIIHSAATISFTESLKNAIEINVKGTLVVLKLAMGMKSLESFVYVSTAFSNCYMKVLEEEIYPHPIQPEALVVLGELLDEEFLKKLTPTFLDKWPNTYTYTKNAAENLVHSFKTELPLAIFRPSIIVATARDPIPAWVNKYVGPYGYMTTTGLGFNRVVHCRKPTMNSNLVPCDLVANAIIAVAWDIGIERRNQVKIYNFSSEMNPITWSDFTLKMLSSYERTPFNNAVWYPVSVVVMNRWSYNLLHFLLEKIPAFVADLPKRATNKKPFYSAFMTKIEENLDNVSHFLRNEFVLKTERLYDLWGKLTPDERNLIDFDLTGLDWDAYFANSMRGIKQYLLREDMSVEAMKKAKSKYFWLFLLHQFFKVGLLSTLLYILRYIYKVIK